MKKNNKSSKKPSRRNLILIGIVTLALCFIAATMILKVLNQQRDMRELDAAGKDLRLIYDELIELNKDNISSSTFGKECSESSVKYGRGDITCGVRGRIFIDNDDPRRASDLINYIVSKFQHSFKTSFVNNDPNEESKYVYMSHRKYDRECYLSYGIGNGGDWAYAVGCNKSVPDFLPGYAIED